jgi:hypothetical protein
MLVQRAPKTRLILCFAFAAAALALGAPASAQAAEKGLVTDLTWDISPAQQDRSGVALTDLQAKWAKVSISWHWAEPQKGTYDEDYLAKVDRAVNVLRARGIHVLSDVNRSPEWASGNANEAYPPLDPADLGAFMKKMAERYRGKMDAWQVWNEPNHPLSWPAGPNAADYVPLLKAGYAGVKQGAPGTPVLFGGLAFNDYKYLEDAYAAEPNLGDFFDVMAVHPYNYKQPPEALNTGPDGRLTKDTFSAYSEIRKTLLAHGDDKSIWLTELGWATCTANADWCVDSEQTAASYLTRAYRLIDQASYVRVALWYNLRNDWWAHDDPAAWVDQLGLMRTDFSPKPAYWAFRAVHRPSVATEPGAAQPKSSPPTPVTATSTTVAVRRLRPRSRRRLKLSGRARGAHTGKVRLVLQRKVHGRWRTKWKKTAAVSGKGRFAKKVAVRRSGRFRVRARYLGTTTFAPSASRYVYFRGPRAH